MQWKLIDDRRLIAEIPDELIVTLKYTNEAVPTLVIGDEIEVPIVGTRVIAEVLVTMSATLAGSVASYTLLLVPREVFEARKTQVVKLLKQ
ncbi:hypothetical protein NIES2135_26430 [Leptolyngbya boryana NIES-2135]|jgi:hypothetical protein|uniref:Uncharacterized protein n=1 Tax=Leptolyngbya boryana NIES-2135 TaxID=1973484 RepID=A0A1Z4JGD8_LEPBY|nr:MULTISPECIES: hypothetical protein [Leptolyngbya]BAY55819.1 hypothetical protein NIES2135_26430 [Leptolyngbya boryana NIES-2135]MBD2368874.1 hypothetical protein [Leptolyngbya sp. FACHB-161]MBD2375258.1 hypothetical protein [Leptolyngbya sp. FACHB-238]MBD2399676.1 hypothetical protein [Leptolyngbya sp. FACHB-239]MBD2405882.1 hypothetical protein [Leptolyngbya sp. FACHB-402]